MSTPAQQKSVACGGGVNSMFITHRFTPFPQNRRTFMNVTISADGLTLTPSIEAHVKGKLERVLKHFDDIVTVRVLLSLEKTENRAQSQCASCNIHVKGADLFAKATSHDLYASIDDLMNKMDGIVLKHKDKTKGHRSSRSGATAQA